MKSSITSKTASFKKSGSSRKSYKKVPTKSDFTDSSRSASPTTNTDSDSETAQETQINEAFDSDLDIDERTDGEKGLFNVVDEGNSNNVAAYLKRHTNERIDINKLNVEGYSVLQIAVKNKNIDIVDILLDTETGIYIDEALLEAVQENYMEMVVKLYNYQITYQKKYEKTTGKKPSKGKLNLDSSRFGKDMTPLKMAAIHGHYEMIEYLYSERGDRLEKFCLPSCKCIVCANSPGGLERSDARIKLLKAMGNPEYIAFMTGEDKSYDPIEKTFCLLNDINQCISEEPEYINEYQEVYDGIKGFPVDMLNMCRNTEETRIFLRSKGGYEGTIISSFAYPRILYAVEMEQKEFISHPHTQDILEQEWEGEIWKTNNAWEKFLSILVHCLVLTFYPIISIFLWLTISCSQKLQWVRWLTRPKMRFYQYTMNYFIFMIILYSTNILERGKLDIGPPSYYLPWVIGFFELGQLISFVSHFFKATGFFKRGWNWFELINHLCWIATLGLWIYVWKDQSNKKNHHHAEERSSLEPDDLRLISEAFMAIASCMTGLRFIKVFFIFKSTGSMLTAMEQLSNDFIKFLIFFVIVIFSYALAIQHLYRPFAIISPDQDKSLTKLVPAMETFFWGLFTMSSSSNSILSDTTVTGSNITYHHLYAESVGKVIWCSYHVLGVTFFFNMLTGLFSNRYSNVTDNVNVEWIFTRSQLYLFFIKDSIISAPFNLVPNTLSLFNIVRWIQLSTCKKNGDQKPGWSLGSCCYVEKRETEQERKEREHAYPKLLRKLLQRYFRSKMYSTSDDPPSKKNVEEIRANLNELKKYASAMKPGICKQVEIEAQVKESVKSKNK